MKKKNDILKKAVSAVRGQAIPQGPPQEVVERVLKSLGDESGSAVGSISITERIKTMKRISKLAVAAVIIAAAVLSISVLDKSVTPAYAIKQTIQAYQGHGYLHFYYYPCTDQNLGKEAWIQYDENGNVEDLRVNLYNRDGKNKHLEEVWGKGVTLFWRRHENTLEIDQNGNYSDVMLGFIKGNDPKQAIESVYEKQEQGICQIETEEGSTDNEPIKITAKYPPGKYSTNRNSPATHDVFVVDAETKLVIRREVYRVLEGRVELQGVFKDYDSQPFDPNIFDIEKEISDDAIRVVHYKIDDVNNVGIDLGSLKKEDAGGVVATEFFNALIAKDYSKASRLFGGMPIDEVEQRFGEFNIVRLVSTGDRVKPGNGLPSYYWCVIEIKENAKLSLWHPKVHIGKVTPHNISRWRVKAVF